MNQKYNPNHRKWHTSACGCHLCAEGFHDKRKLPRQKNEVSREQVEKRFCCEYARTNGIFATMCETCWKKMQKNATSSEGKPKSEDPVNHPQHYNQGKFEVIEVINDWKLDFNLGNVIKYVARAKHKGKELEDLKKALYYLNDAVERAEFFDKATKAIERIDDGG